MGQDPKYVGIPGLPRADNDLDTLSKGFGGRLHYSGRLVGQTRHFSVS